MSKQNIASTRGEGTSTSRTLANVVETVKELDRDLDAHAVTPLEEGSNRLLETANVLRLIRHLIANTQNHGNESASRDALRNIDLLAGIGAARAIDAHNFAECELETLRDETIPAIMAALEGR